MRRIALLICIASLFLSCEKGEDGKPGKDGKDGRDGQNGFNGRDGKDAGKFKVIKFTAYSSDWLNDISQYILFLNSSLITSNVVENGTVVLYFQSSDGSQAYKQLPCPWSTGGSSNLWSSFEFWVRAGGVIVVHRRSDGNAIHPYSNSSITSLNFKAVIIEPNQMERYNSMNNKELDQLLNSPD